MATKLRILTYNIHKGFSLTHRHFVLETIRLAIREADADLVFLQEVIGDHSRHAARITTWKPQQFEYLADEIWPHFAYGKNAIYDEGNHGNAVLSKFPILSFENFDISSPHDERRGILRCAIGLPEKGGATSLECFCTHLELSGVSRAAQFEKICEYINGSVSDAHPLVIAGDFNDWRGRACAILEDRLKVREAFKSMHGKVAKTFPSLFPFLPLDRVYTRGLLVKSVDVLRGKPWTTLSDHLPLAVEVECTGGKTS